MDALLDSRQLRAYLCLARLGSFIGAARELGLTQSAISHAIKTLEAEVGCRLLHRVGKKISLTQAGEQLLFHAEKIQREMTAARQGLARMGTWGQLTLRVAATHSACQYILPAVIREFREGFPTCALTVETADNPELLDMLRGQRADLALGLQPQRDVPLEFLALFEDELVFLLHPLHPWAQAGRVDRATITRQSYVLYRRTSSTFQMAQDYLHAEGLSLPGVMECGSMEAIKELLKAGLGVSILPPWIVRKELSERSLVSLPLGRRKLRRRWGILHWRERRLSLAEETFVTLCRSVTEDWRISGEMQPVVSVQPVVSD